MKKILFSMTFIHILILSLFLTNNSFAQDATASVSGICKKDGMNLPGVKITADPTHSTTTDKKGAYKIDGLIKGQTYQLTPSLIGCKFTPAARSVQISSDAITDINFNAKSFHPSGIRKPTEVTGCIAWFDAADPKNDGTHVPGKIDAWLNKADASNLAYQPAVDKQPTLVNNVLNGKPVMRFTGGMESFSIVDPKLKGVYIDNVNTIFWVIKQSMNRTQDGCPFFMGNTGGPSFHRGIGDANTKYAFDGKYWDDEFSAKEVRDGKTFLDGKKLDGTKEMFIPGEFHVVSLLLNGPVIVNALTQDRNGLYGPRSWQGDIAEIIIYNRVLPSDEREMIENYLRKKWFKE